jgi:AbrB family looped-hinge helix DNA binding protein
MSTKVLSPGTWNAAGAQTGLVNEKGQVVIPAEMRKRMGLTAGSRVVFWTEGQHVVFSTVENFVEELPGILGPGPSLEQMRDKDHRQDKQR